ncbi:MAG: muramoyltetrapeptide carboxypeptidase [Chloroflexota bacterium]|jgi:muramoyltetrapeptide carboxypeptidase|nr:muramoyltetrapeptide carboxypeptidase [Chloroflexota bacterium]
MTTDDAPRKPRRLRPGDTVAVVAPASSWESRSELLRGVAGLEAWDLNVKLGAHVNDRHGYMAGTDVDRAEDLHAALTDPDVDAIVCLQGGYGTPRLIPLLDEAAFAANPKALCGYSDLTTLHLAEQAWGNVISFYANGATGIGSPEVTEFSKASLKRALFSDEPYGPIGPNPDDPYVRTIVPGRATGRLTGGCAGLLSSAIGTRLQPDFRGRIVILEEIENEGYIHDGILTQLRNAGLFDGAAGIVVGDIKAKWSGGIAELSAEDIVEEVLAPLGLPLIFGLPIGHNKHHATVPLGALATLDADAGTLVVEEVVTRD